MCRDVIISFGIRVLFLGGVFPPRFREPLLSFLSPALLSLNWVGPQPFVILKVYPSHPGYFSPSLPLSYPCSESGPCPRLLNRIASYRPTDTNLMAHTPSDKQRFPSQSIHHLFWKSFICFAWFYFPIFFNPTYVLHFPTCTISNPSMSLLAVLLLIFWCDMNQAAFDLRLVGRRGSKWDCFGDDYKGYTHPDW